MSRYAGIRGVGLAGSDEELLSLIADPFTADERREIRERSRAAAYQVEKRASAILASDMKLTADARMALARALDQAAHVRRGMNSDERRQRADEERSTHEQ